MKHFLIFVAVVCMSAWSVRGKDEALRECGDLLHTDIHHIPNFRGEFANDRCLLKCYTGNVVLSTNTINEGFPCEPESKGICRNGHCVAQQKEAQKSCEKLHHFDFTKLNSTGTMFANDQCSLKCAIDGKVISVNSINENAPCPTNSNGVCHKGFCVTDGKPITDKPIDPTKPTDPTPVNPNSSIEEVEVTILKATILEDFTGQDVSAEVLVHVENDCRSEKVKYSGSQIGFNKKCTAEKIKSKDSSLYIQIDYHLTDETALGGFYSMSLGNLLKQLSAKSPNQHEFEEKFELHNFLVNNIPKHTADVTLRISFKLSKN